MLDFCSDFSSNRDAHIQEIEQRLLSRNSQAGQSQHILRYISRIRNMLNAPVRIAILGEVNTGKTQVANLILGINVLPSSVINNTFCPTLLRYGEIPHVRQFISKTRFRKWDASELHRLVQQTGYLADLHLPLPLLKAVELIDFPAFENIDLAGKDLAFILKRSDMMIWCSTALRSWTASEKQAWLQIPDRLKTNCLFILTHADNLSSDAHSAILTRISSEIELLKTPPILLATTSAIEARNPRGQIMNPSLWKASGGEQFFKRLSDLLEATASAGRQKLSEGGDKLLKKLDAVPAADKELPLLREWQYLMDEISKNLGDEGVEELADDIARSIRNFKRKICLPQLRAQNSSLDEIESFMDLLPDTKEYFVDLVKGRKSLILALHQVKTELEEYDTKGFYRQSNCDLS